MRKPPAIDAPLTVTPKELDIITQVREYQLITPLFGGGVTPAEADPVTIIRATEIRGHLRFWWRACRGGQFQDVAAMKKAEDTIWGAAYKKDDTPIPQEKTVQITVEILNIGTPIKPFRVEKDKRERNQAKPYSGIPPYAAFPLLPDQNELKKPQSQIQVKDVLDNVSFRLTLSFPQDNQKDIEAALWAWETFGGLGARTRRGFGALHLLKIDGAIYNDLPSVVGIKEWLEKKISVYVKPGTAPVGTPHLGKNIQIAVTTPMREPKEAWRHLIKRLSEFRQTPYGREGRSLWPEPEAVREITRRRHFKYKPRQQARKFPRAAFGLPIIFHFKDPGEPADSTLQGTGQGSDRLASPLILRPLLCKDGQITKAVGLAIVLDSPRTPPQGLSLIEKGNEKHPHSVNSALTPAEAKTLPMLDGEPDVLKAFLKFL
jgi:CRISPR-associated protein Cmr1